MSKIRATMMLASCALAGSAVAAMAVLEPPSNNNQMKNGNGVVSTRPAPVQDATLARPAGTEMIDPNRTINQNAVGSTTARTTAPPAAWPNINDPASFVRPAPRVGVDMGVNDPDRIATITNQARESGPPPENCVCIEDYFPGDIVQAAVANPQGNAQIPLGAVGTVICGRFFLGGEEDLVLVEWDIDNGHDGFEACDCPSDGVATDGQGYYVFCNEIMPAVECVCVEDFNPGDTVYATEHAFEGNGQIQRGDAGTVICGRQFLGGENDLILVQWDNVTNGHDGFGACDCPIDGAAAPGTGWYVPCNNITKTPPTDCQCPDDVYFPGETMYATVDSPLGNPQIFAGDAATVICGSSTFADEILGEWGGINNGHNGNGFCGCPAGGVATSPFGWWVYCEHIHPRTPPILCGDCAGEYGIGDVVWARADGIQGQPDISRGQRGVVVCGNAGSPPLLVQWDGLTSGHNGNGACDCPGGAATPPGTGWFVQCHHVSRKPIPCAGDTNHDNQINVTDLLALLADWGPCAGCLTDMNGDDVVNVSDLLILLAAWGFC